MDADECDGYRHDCAIGAAASGRGAKSIMIDLVRKFKFLYLVFDARAINLCSSKTSDSKNLSTVKNYVVVCQNTKN